MSEVSSRSSEPIFYPEAFREHLETRCEITDLEVVEKQLRVLLEHIASLREKQSNVIVPASCSTKCLNEAHIMQSSDGEQEGEMNVGGDQGKAKWSSLFVNSLASQGMVLDYIPPDLKNGKPVVRLKVQELNKAELNWKFVVMLYTPDEGMGVGNVVRYVKAAWAQVSPILRGFLNTIWMFPYSVK